MPSNKSNKLAQSGNADAITEAGAPSIDSYLSMFQLSRKADDKYSQSIEIYDALPKHTLGQCEFKETNNGVQVRKCIIRGEEFTIKVKAALIERKDRATKSNYMVLRYPSEREDFVESALRKLAVKGNARWVNDTSGVGVDFTLYELQQELKKTGHNYNLNDLKESLEVLNSCSLDITNSDGSINLASPILPIKQLVDMKTYKDSKSKARCLAVFHPLITRSMLNLSYRNINYGLLMSLKNHLARHMFRRMTHYWVQASPKDPYTVGMISFLEQSPRGVSETMADNTRAMRTLLKELEEKGITSKVDAVEEKRGRAIVDIKYTIYPSDTFVREQKVASKRLKDIRNAIGGKTDVL